MPVVRNYILAESLQRKLEIKGPWPQLDLFAYFLDKPKSKKQIAFTKSLIQFRIFKRRGDFTDPLTFDELRASYGQLIIVNEKQQLTVDNWVVIIW